jgi:hypothetical protein
MSEVLELLRTNKEKAVVQIEFAISDFQRRDLLKDIAIRKESHHRTPSARW